mmetsp:Transcript_1846/g.4100  ORF Transcript_1846/g.4100 Transcript_1846/m.4100 type:complete len:279 (+) Transcript_1846:271-1107(+)
MLQRGGRILGTTSSIALENSSSMGLMRAVWAATPALTTRACKADAFSASSTNFSIARRVPPHMKPLGNRQLEIWQRGGVASVSLAFASSQRSSSLARSMPATAHWLCGTNSAVFCMRLPRSCTNLKPSSKSKTSATHNAVHSPPSRPDTASGQLAALPRISVMRCIAAMPATNMAGWLYCDSMSLSSGPFKHKSLRSQPRTRLAFSSKSLTTGRSAQLCIIPTTSEPSPGKSNAAAMGSVSTACNTAPLLRPSSSTVCKFPNMDPSTANSQGRHPAFK